MAFTVNFYNFTKRENSTAQPSGSGRSFNCILKENSSVIDPVIILDLGTDNAPTYNYAFIPAYGRYYAVTEWTWVEHRLWSASLSCDVLASYKSAIGNKDLYILRSSAASNGRVVDSKYPTLAKPSSYIDSSSSVKVENKAGTSQTYSDYWTRSLSGGYYYLGIAGENATGVTWYCANYLGFKGILQELMAYEPDDMTDVSTGVAKQLANPMQYIVGCYWLPFYPIGVNLASRPAINFGYYTVSGGTHGAWAEVDPVGNMCKCSMNFSIRKHPQASTRGLYLNQAPFSNYRLSMLPFGTFPLDGSLMIDDSTVSAEWWTDFSTGQAELTIKATNTLMAKTRSMLGVPINLTQVTVDVLGATSSALSGFGGFLDSLATGDIFGAASSALGGFQGAAQAAQPKITMTGGGGDFLAFCGNSPAIYSDFYQIMDEYNADLGRPLCEIRKPSDLPGYLLCEEGDVPISGTAREAAAIRSYLESGFFYE